MPLNGHSEVSAAESMRMRLHQGQHEHAKSLARMTSKMTLTSALDILQKKGAAKPEVLTLVQAALQQGTSL